MSNWDEGAQLDRCHKIIYDLKAEKRELEERIADQIHAHKTQWKTIGEMQRKIGKLEEERGRDYIEGIQIKPSSIRVHDNEPKRYRLAKRPDGGLFLQGRFDWTQGTMRGHTWRMLNTVGIPNDPIY